MDELPGCIAGLVVISIVVALAAGYGLLVIAFYIVMIALGFAISIPVCLVYLLCYGYWRVFVDSHKMQRSWALLQPRPAFTAYAFGPGWRVCNYIVTNLSNHIANMKYGTRFWYKQAEDIWNSTAAAAWYWRAGAGAVPAGFSCVALGIAILTLLVGAVFLLLQYILLAIWYLFSLLILGIAAGCSSLFTWAYGIFCICPGCHKQMPVGVYYCPTANCNMAHNNLRPNFCGTFYHRCKGCSHILPTVGWLGRRKLHRVCAKCGDPLNIGVGTGTNIHIPVIGGRSAGKTIYLTTTTQEFKHVYETKLGYTVEFTDPNQERNFAVNLNRLQSGRELDPTIEIVPAAYNLKIQAPYAPVPKLAYVYDAAGEAFGNGENIRRQEYFKYIDGLIFMIDPFSLQRYYLEHQGQIDSVKNSLRPCNLRPVHAYERMLQMFEASVSFRKRRKYKQPLAVVVTKADALGLDDEIGSSAAHRLMAKGTSISEEEAIHRLVRDFLCRYESVNFVESIEAYFSNVRYFSCSSLGRAPDLHDMRPYTPERVLYPLTWLLARSRAIRKRAVA